MLREAQIWKHVLVPFPSELCWHLSIFNGVIYLLMSPYTFVTAMYGFVEHRSFSSVDILKRI